VVIPFIMPKKSTPIVNTKPLLYRKNSLDLT
jgi:hypothetical protein